MSNFVASMFLSLGIWSQRLLAFAAGAALSLTLAPFHLWPILFFSIPIFYALLQLAARPWHAIATGFVFGYGFFMAGTWWIGNALLVDAAQFGWLLPFSILGLSAVMALWFALFGGVIFALRRVMTPLLFALVWVMIEILRSLGMFGFPWNLLGYAAFASLPLAQFAALVGVYGLSLLLVWFALVPLYWLGPTLHRCRGVVTLCVVLIAVGSFGYGQKRLDAPSAMTDTQLRLVQPAIPQEVKGTRAGQSVAIKLLTEGTEQRSDAQGQVITIWPETAYPFTVRGAEHFPLPKLPGPLLTGALRVEAQEGGARIYNSLIAVS
jgi:apolipoprotein N-acyltransferase